MTGAFVPRHVTMAEFARRVYDLRMARGWSQADLSRHTGINKGTISEWSRGQSLPNPENLVILAKTLGVTPEELMPNRIEETATNERQPEFAITAAGQNGYSWLSISRLVKTKTALKIGQLLQDDDDTSD